MNYREFINLTHAFAWHGAQTAGHAFPDEPALVSSFVEPQMLSQLEAIARAQVPQQHWKISSIFAHKTPTVHPHGETGPVEIADLMLVRLHISNATPARGRAFLLQAKRSPRPTTGAIPFGKPQIQFRLYQNWPIFEGTTRLPRLCCNTQAWSFAPPPAGLAYGRYLILYNEQAFCLAASLSDPPIPVSGSSFVSAGFPGDATWAHGLALPTAATPVRADGTEDFSVILEHFVSGNEGIPFEPGLFSTSDHWSTFVNTMLLYGTDPGYAYLAAARGVTQRQPRGGVISSFPRFVAASFMLRDSPHLLGYILGAPPFSPAMRAVDRDLHLLSYLAGAPEFNSDEPPVPPFETMRSSDEGPGTPAILLAVSAGNEVPEGLRGE